MTSRPTHADGIAAAERIAAEHGLTLTDLRPYAADRLSEGWPAEEGMGSSDISIELASLGNHEPEALRTEAARLAERNALVTRISASTGRTFDDTLRGLQDLLATH